MELIILLYKLVYTDGVFQYVVSYSSPRNMLNEHKDLIGSTRAFDGSTLYLPIKITDTFVIRVSKRATDAADIEITIALTNVLHFNETFYLHSKESIESVRASTSWETVL